MGSASASGLASRLSPYPARLTENINQLFISKEKGREQSNTVEDGIGLSLALIIVSGALDYKTSELASAHQSISGYHKALGSRQKGKLTLCE